MARKIKRDILKLIEQFEGCRLDAYQDLAGIWTIGYGHIKGVMPGMKIAQTQADQVFVDDLSNAESVVDNATAGVATSDNQFGAMVSLCFNIGSANFRASTVLCEHRGGKLERAADAFLLWNKSHRNGKLQEVEGLTKRRQAEQQLYLTL
jgi:lysozyme